MSGDIRSVVGNDGVELAYEVLGAGPTVVMLHGGLAGRAAFSRQREALGAHFRLVLPSARGNDGTDPTLPTDYGFSSSELRDLLTVLDAEGIESCHLVSHSSGGALAFEFARRYPERLCRLVLIEPSLIGLLPPDRQAWLRDRLTELVEIDSTHGPLECVAASLAMVGGAAWAALDDEVKQMRLAPFEAMSPTMAPHWQGLMELEVEPQDLAGFHDATLLIYARDASEFFSFEPDIGACWARERPDLQLIRVPGAGHNVHRDQPDIVNKAILEFLASG